MGKRKLCRKKNPTKLNKLENEKQMWIGNSQNNIDKLVHDVNAANSYRAGKGYMIGSDEDNGLWTKTPEQAKNRNGNERGLAGNKDYSSNYNRYDRKDNNNNNGNLGNMRRITPMIMNKNSKY